MAGRKYLAAHGIDSREIVDAYCLGVVIEPLQGDERFAGMLAIPYLSRRGGVRAVKFRSLADDGPKMAQYQGQEARPFNPDAFFSADTVIGVAEGEIDAITATEVLGLPTVGIPGVQVWAAHQATWRRAFLDFRTVVMFADGDPPDKATGQRPGRELASALLAAVQNEDTDVKVIECPEGQDVSSMVASGRAAWLTEKLAAAMESTTADEDDDD